MAEVIVDESKIGQKVDGKVAIVTGVDSFFAHDRQVLT